MASAGGAPPEITCSRSRTYRACSGASSWAGLERLRQEGALELGGGVNPPDFQPVVAQARRHPWVVYVKRPFAGPEQVLRYLARSTHRVAIGNGRLVALDRAAGRVTFAYKDYAEGSRHKTMSLALAEFLRRFRLHILPERFVKIRHYGLLGNRDREAHLAQARARIASAEVAAARPNPSPAEPSAARGGPPDKPRIQCPHCGSTRLALVRLEPPRPAALDSS